MFIEPLEDPAWGCRQICWKKFEKGVPPGLQQSIYFGDPQAGDTHDSAVPSMMPKIVLSLSFANEYIFFFMVPWLGALRRVNRGSVLELQLLFLYICGQAEKLQMPSFTYVDYMKAVEAGRRRDFLKDWKRVTGRQGGRCHLLFRVS